jgi:hypothetical protein
MLLVIIGLVIPIVVIFMAGLVRTAVRKSFDLRDYYLGLDYAVGTLATAATYGIDLANRTVAFSGSDKDRLDKVVLVFVAAVFAAFAFLVLVVTHQLWESRIDALPDGPQKRSESWKLLLVSDGLGIVCLAAFLLIVKGL